MLKLGLDARKLRDGGIGTYIQQLLRGLAADGHAPETVVLARSRDLDAVGRMMPAARCIASDSALYSLAEHVVPPFRAFRAGVTLYHAPHYTLPAAWPGRAVVTVHDLIHLRHARFFPAGARLYARTVAGLAVRRARIVMTDSDDTRRDVIELLGARPQQVRTVRLAPDPEMAPRDHVCVQEFVKARGLPADYLLYVGARKPHKNLRLVLQALGRIPPEVRPPLVLSGPPWRADDPHARAAYDAGVAERVHFAGTLEDAAELACLYSGARLYVQPSITEGFGLPPLEAMACGIPVLASTGGALPEALGDAAELLPPEDPAAWASSIVRLLSDAERRAELTRRGHARARARSWADVTREVLEIYREAAG